MVKVVEVSSANLPEYGYLGHSVKSMEEAIKWAESLLAKVVYVYEREDGVTAWIQLEND